MPTHPSEFCPSFSVSTAMSVALVVVLSGLLLNLVSAQSTRDAKELMTVYCADCHGPEKQKGKIRFDTISELSQQDRNELMNLAHEAVHFGDMPPEDEAQPSKAERKAILAYLSGQAGQEANEELQEKLRYPKYGNVVDHERLFSGEIKEAAYTPSRRWLVNPEIFLNRVMNVFELNDHERRWVNLRGLYGVTNPFVLPDQSGVRDYDVRMLSGGHLITMMGNAKWIADKQVFATKHQGKPKDEVTHPNPADTWYPGNFAPEEFKAILNAQGMPEDALIEAAVQKQFHLVLRRDPEPKELQQYVNLTRDMITRSNNEDGLTQMLKTVLLEPDFLYRVELGAGETDEFGRQMLSPLEGAFAISHALGDRVPDEKLLQAAHDGRLSTAVDYRREVDRLLADETYFHGVVDPRVEGTSSKPVEYSHPKIIRFFRDFFGYPIALNIFKDSERIENNYINLSRGTAGTPAAIVSEADKLVAWHVSNDQRVFENLLTSDRYFVYDNLNSWPPGKAEAVVAEWEEVWNKLKDTPWETDPKAVWEEHKEYLKGLKLTPIKDNRRRWGHVSLRVTMRFFSEYFPRGLSPYPIFPWSHGNHQRHSLLYSLPKYRGDERYSKFWDDLTPEQKAEKPWDYPIEQPFSIPNRKGILSHPAWLIAHAHNFQTDPVKRGLWIQEKLLANRVPDVPITVDAKIPDHPDKTLRTRLTEKTQAESCWRCHQHMNPLGVPFEMYDDFGRFREREAIEFPENLIKQGDGQSSFNVYKTLPIDASGVLKGTGNPELDGEVKDALDLIERLGKSKRVRQSIIRHTFRYFMGRNEMLSDSQTLIDMDRAYLESGGSFKAVIVSLLSSDSFIYRKSTNTK